jgi:hypothetical protein
LQRPAGGKTFYAYWNRLDFSNLAERKESSETNPHDFSLDGLTKFPQDWFRQARLSHLEQLVLLAPDVLSE